MKTIADVIRGCRTRKCLAILAILLQPAVGNTAQEVTGIKPSELATHHITGKESMWGIVGVPDAKVLALVNASPLLASELNDYQNAVDQSKAKPFAKPMFQIWTGTKIETFVSGAVQIQIAPEVLAEPPADFVGDLSHGLGYFASFARQQARNSASANVTESVEERRVAGPPGASMETEADAEAEVSNYLVQQQIIAATHSIFHRSTVIKLANDSNSGGILQKLFDEASASDRTNSFTETEHRTHLEKIANEITGLIPVTRRPTSSQRVTQPLAEGQSPPTLPTTENELNTRTAFVRGFAESLVRVANSGALNDADKTMSLLGISFHADTVQKVPSPPDCTVGWRPRSLLVTSISLDEGQNWLKPTQYGAKPEQTLDHLQKQRNTTAFVYTLSHGIRCGDSGSVRISVFKAGLRFTRMVERIDLHRG